MPRHQLTNAHYAAAIGAALLLPVGAWAVELQPHSAVYEVRLTKAAASTQIEDARGVVRIDWRESCSEWTVEQRFQLVLALGDGSTSSSTTVYRSSESKDGRRFRFESRTERDGELEENVVGEVERATATAAATVRYEEPPGLSIALKEGAAFPMQHQLALIEAAAKGTGTVDRPYFDGPRPEDQPYAVNAVLGLAPHPSSEGALKLQDAPFDRPWATMELAFFPNNSTGATPAFELKAEIQDNGIARAMWFDYGAMAISAIALGGETVARPRC